MNWHYPPSVELPQEISDEAAAVLVAFLQELVTHAESTYFVQLRRYYEAANNGCGVERQYDLWTDGEENEAPF